MDIVMDLSNLDYSSATDGHTEPAITLLDGRTLPCYPKRDDDVYLTNSLKWCKSERAEKFFNDHACFFFDHRERILSDSRMFLTPVPRQIELGGFYYKKFTNNPTLGVYIEWWMYHAPAIIGRSGKETWLVCDIEGNQRQGINRYSVVNQKGERKSLRGIGEFRHLWEPYVSLNTRYDEAKQRYDAYSLYQVVEQLEADEKVVSQPERALDFLDRENVLFLHRIWGLYEPSFKEKESLKIKMLKHIK